MATTTLEYRWAIYSERLRPPRELLIGIVAGPLVFVMVPFVLEAISGHVSRTPLFVLIVATPILVVNAAARFQVLHVFDDAVIVRSMTGTRRVLRRDIAAVERLEWRPFLSADKKPQLGVKLTLHRLRGARTKVVRLRTNRPAVLISLLSPVSPGAVRGVIAVDEGESARGAGTEFEEVLVGQKRASRVLLQGSLFCLPVGLFLATAVVSHRRVTIGFYAGVTIIGCYFLGLLAYFWFRRIRTQVNSAGLTVTGLIFTDHVAAEDIAGAEDVKNRGTIWGTRDQDNPEVCEHYRADTPTAVLVHRRDGVALRIDTLRSRELLAALNAIQIR